MLPKTSGLIHNTATLPVILWTFNVWEPLQDSRVAPTSGDLKPFFAWIGLPLRCGWIEDVATNNQPIMLWETFDMPERLNCAWIIAAPSISEINAFAEDAW
jgi:hypothetical protein